MGWNMEEIMDNQIGKVCSGEGVKFCVFGCYRLQYLLHMQMDSNKYFSLRFWWEDNAMQKTAKAGTDFVIIKCQIILGNKYCNNS